jgi:hypothetical protein
MYSALVARKTSIYQGTPCGCPYVRFLHIGTLMRSPYVIINNLTQ